MTREEKIAGLEELAKSFIDPKHGQGTPTHRLGRGFVWLLREYRGQQRRLVDITQKLARAKMVNSFDGEVEGEETVQ